MSTRARRQWSSRSLAGASRGSAIRGSASGICCSKSAAERPGAVDPAGGQLDRGLQLLGLAKVVMDRVRQGRAGQFHDALMALGFAALIDRIGDEARALRAAGTKDGCAPGSRRQGGHGLAVELGIAPQLARGVDVGHHHAQGARPLLVCRVKMPSNFKRLLSAPARARCWPNWTATGSG